MCERICVFLYQSSLNHGVSKCGMKYFWQKKKKNVEISNIAFLYYIKQMDT